MRTRIKVCGVTRREDFDRAARLGVDAVGLVFAPPSPRRLEASQAARVAARRPPFMAVVALFMDQDAGEVERVVRALRPDCLQFHGDEDAAFCESFGRPYIKAVPMASAVDVARVARAHPAAQALTLDAHRRGEGGGSGVVFDWSKWPQDIDMPLILAGGLGPDNVADGIAHCRPAAVDVASGLESSTGVKDHALMDAFVAAVAAADRAHSA